MPYLPPEARLVAAPDFVWDISGWQLLFGCVVETVI
jgi:hypothetical protein